MALTQVSTGGIKDGQVQTADLADSQVTAAKLHADALDRTYTLGADGSNHYTFTGEGLTGAVNDPTLYLTRGKTYRFVNGNSNGAHPFRIQTTVNGSAGTEYNTGVTNNGGAGGSTIVFEVPHAAPDVLYYQCTSHGSMGGILYVTGALADGTVTTAKLADDAVTSAKIADNAVVRAAINADAVSTSKIEGSAVTTAKIADEAVTLAKLEHGTSSNDGKFLRANNGADPTFETVSGTTINNNADNRIITGSGTANTLEAESSVVIDSSSRLLVGKTASKASDGENTAKAQIESTGNCMLDIAANGTTSSSYAALNLIRSDGSSVNDHTAVDSGDRIARINFIGADGSDRFNSCASIRAYAASDFTANNCPGYLTIETNGGSAAPSERMRIDNLGAVTVTGSSSMFPNAQFNVISDKNVETDIDDMENYHLALKNPANDTGEAIGLAFGITDDDHKVGAAILHERDGAGSQGSLKFLTRPSNSGPPQQVAKFQDNGTKNFGAFSNYSGGHNIFSGAASASDFALRLDGVGSGGGNFIQFVNAYGQMGSITYNAGTTYYNTSSDYRLKENTVSISDGITKVKQLKPIRFNWKANKDITVDGFLAHQVTPVVPEAVIGEKDATQTTYYGGSDTIPEGKHEGDVKEENAILPQQLDAAKLIPVLTAALKEAIAKIETLETKVAALEAG